jgi:uncharacterized membrane protein YfcA
VLAMRKYANEVVMFLGLSIALGGLFQSFTNNPQLVVAISLSAVFFSLFDLAINMFEKSYNVQKCLLFLGIFSIVVIPYLSFLSPFLKEHSNYFSLYGLAVVIFLIGFRQNRQERNDNSKLKQLIDDQNTIIEQQKHIIDVLNDDRKIKRESPFEEK